MTLKFVVCWSHGVCFVCKRVATNILLTEKKPKKKRKFYLVPVWNFRWCRETLITRYKFSKKSHCNICLYHSEWDVVYCSVPTSPGGGYRSALGRLVFKTNEMVQVVEAPETVQNRVAFSLFGFLDGEVSLTGELSHTRQRRRRHTFSSISFETVLLLSMHQHCSYKPNCIHSNLNPVSSVLLKLPLRLISL